MAHLLQLTPVKTYATKANAIKAVEKKCGPNQEHAGSSDALYFIHQGDDGRFFPVFIGERALRAMMHFHFNVVA